jgi:hypothetical protein
MPPGQTASRCLRVVDTIWRQDFFVTRRGKIAVFFNERIRSFGDTTQNDQLRRRRMSVIPASPKVTNSVVAGSGTTE